MKYFGLWLWPTILLRLLLWMMLLFGLAGLVYLCAGAWLAWPVAQPHRADAVLVLGGGDGARYARGRELVLAGFAQQLVLIEPNVESKGRRAPARCPA